MRSAEDTLIEQNSTKIEEIKRKINNYVGGKEGIKKLEIALMKVLRKYSSALIKHPFLHEQHITAAIEARKECAELEIKHQFTTDASHSMHFISDCYFNLDRNQSNLANSYYWINKAQQQNSEIDAHKKWCSTVSNVYIDYLYDILATCEPKQLFDDCILLYKEIISINQQQHNYGRVYDALLRLFDLYCKKLNCHEIYYYNNRINELFDLLQNMTQCLLQAKNYTSILPNDLAKLEVIQRKINYLVSKMINLGDYLSFGMRPRSNDEFFNLERMFLQLISIFKSLEKHEASAIIYASLANLYYIAAVDDHVLKTEIHMNRMYDYADIAIKLSPNKQPPRKLLAAEIYEMYGSFYVQPAPLKAQKAYILSLQIIEHQCKDDRIPYFSLKGMGVCLKKLATLRIEQQDYSDNYWQDIDADLQMAIRYLNDALTYYDKHLQHSNLKKNDCVVMLSQCHFQLGLHYEKLLNAKPDSLDPALIEHRYLRAVYLANECEDYHLIAKIHYQLANFYYFHQKFENAVSSWNESVKNYIKAIIKRIGITQQLTHLCNEYEAIQNMDLQSNTQKRNVYNALLRNLTRYSEEINQQMPIPHRRQISAFLRDMNEQSGEIEVRDTKEKDRTESSSGMGVKRSRQS